MQQLLEYLSTMSPGEIADVGQLDSLLAACWDQFDGGNAEGMEAYKLLGRMESISWNPPVLSFTIERHGGTVLGSTRADLQSWEVNVRGRCARGVGFAALVNPVILSCGGLIWVTGCQKSGRPASSADSVKKNPSFARGVAGENHRVASRPSYALSNRQ
jgi:hypothetical protein